MKIIELQIYNIGCGNHISFLPKRGVHIKYAPLFPFIFFLI